MTDVRLIRKYVNRRLYDTAQSRYVNLEDLRELIVRGGQLRVVEQSTGSDITTPVFLQIIAESQKGGAQMLSPEFLAGLIRAAAGNPDPEFAGRLDRALRSALVSQPGRLGAVPAGNGAVAAA